MNGKARKTTLEPSVADAAKPAKKMHSETTERDGCQIILEPGVEYESEWYTLTNTTKAKTVSFSKPAKVAINGPFGSRIHLKVDGENAMIYEAYKTGIELDDKRAKFVMEWLGQYLKWREES